MGLSTVVAVSEPRILIVDAAPVQTTFADAAKADATDKTPQNNPTATKKERPKWLQWANEHKAILICIGGALLLWLAIKKGIINWN